MTDKPNAQERLEQTVEAHVRRFDALEERVTRIESFLVLDDLRAKDDEGVVVGMTASGTKVLGRSRPVGRLVDESTSVNVASDTIHVMPTTEIERLRRIEAAAKAVIDAKRVRGNLSAEHWIAVLDALGDAIGGEYSVPRSRRSNECPCGGRFSLAEGSTTHATCNKCGAAIKVRHA